MAKQRNRAQKNCGSWVNEDAFLLDDPGGSPFEWLEVKGTLLRQAVRRLESDDPWLRTEHACEHDALTERRRRKLQDLSLSKEDELFGEKESVA